MQLNLLFLPLLGGYVFYCKWHGTRFYAARCSGQRLLFHAAAVGLLLLVTARLIVMVTPVLFRHEAVAVPLVVYAVLGSIGSLCVSLGMVALDRWRTEELKNALGTQKPFMGFMIATIVLAILVLLFSGAAEEGARRSIAAAVTGVLVITLGSAVWVTAFRFVIRKLETSLYHQFRFSAMFLRTSLLVFIVSLALLAWMTTTSLAEGAWRQFSPYADSGTAFLACMLGALVWWPLNLVLPFQVANARLYRDLKTNSLEHLLYRAALDSSLVQVTLKDGKVYVGFVTAVPPDPAAPDVYMQMLPTMSGYRDPDTRKVVFTTYYDEAYQTEDVEPEDFVKVLPIANVESAGFFREDVYLRFLRANSPDVQPQPAVGEAPISGTDPAKKSSPGPGHSEVDSVSGLLPNH